MSMTEQQCPICHKCFLSSRDSYSSHDHKFGKYTAVYHTVEGLSAISVWIDNPDFQTLFHDSRYVRVIDLNDWVVLDEQRIEKLLLLQ